MDRKNYYLWLDLETTGLDTATCAVLEIATLFYDPDRDEVLWETQHFLRAPQTLSFDRTAYLMLAKNGLHTDYATGQHVGPKEASRDICRLVETSIQPGSLVHLAGSGVAEYDRRIIERVLPDLDALLHWRAIDIGIFRRTWRQMTGEEFPEHPAFKQVEHRAQADIPQALEQYRWFRNQLRQLSSH